MRLACIGIVLASVALLVALGGCASARFYAQAAVGQASLMLPRRDAASVADDPATDPAVAEKLRLVAAMRRFAETELALLICGCNDSPEDVARYARLLQAETDQA